MKKQIMKLLSSITLAYGLSILFASVVSAAVPPDMASAMGRMNTFMVNAGAALNNILTDPNLTAFINAEWNTFTIAILVMTLIKWNWGGIRMYEIVHPIMLIMITRIMLNNYDMLTGLCWDWSEGVAGGIQNAVIGNTNPFFYAGFISDVINGLSWKDGRLFGSISSVMMASAISGVVLLLSVMSFFASTWALYGYALSKIIGWFFIPFIMIPRLSFLFDGWVRLFLGFIVYNVIARANLLLTVIALKSFFGITGNTVNTSWAFRLDFTTIGDIFGLMAFLMISILALISTGRFATAIVSGAGGFGQAISTAAYTAVRVLKGI